MKLNKIKLQLGDFLCTICIKDLDWTLIKEVRSFFWIIFDHFWSEFWGSWGSSKNWLEPRINCYIKLSWSKSLIHMIIVNISQYQNCTCKLGLKPSCKIIFQLFWRACFQFKRNFPNTNITHTLCYTFSPYLLWSWTNFVWPGWPGKTMHFLHHI